MPLCLDQVNGVKDVFVLDTDTAAQMSDERQLLMINMPSGRKDFFGLCNEVMRPASAWPANQVAA